MRHSKQRNSFTKRNHEKQVVLRRESSKIVKIIHKNREGIAGTLKESRNYAIEESRFDMKKSRYRRKGVGVSPERSHELAVRELPFRRNGKLKAVLLWSKITSKG